MIINDKNSQQNKPEIEAQQLIVRREDLMGLCEQLVRFDDISTTNAGKGLEKACHVFDGSYSREKINAMKSAVHVLNHCADIRDAIKILNDALSKNA